MCVCRFCVRQQSHRLELIMTNSMRTPAARRAYMQKRAHQSCTNVLAGSERPGFSTTTSKAESTTTTINIPPHEDRAAFASKCVCARANAPNQHIKRMSLVRTIIRHTNAHQSAAQPHRAARAIRRLPHPNPTRPTRTPRTGEAAAPVKVSINRPGTGSTTLSVRQAVDEAVSLPPSK